MGSQSLQEEALTTFPERCVAEAKSKQASQCAKQVGKAVKVRGREKGVVGNGAEGASVGHKQLHKEST